MIAARIKGIIINFKLSSSRKWFIVFLLIFT